MAKVTISFEDMAGDIPTYELTKNEILEMTFLDEQLSFREGEVIVCFHSFKDEVYERQHPDIFVTNNAGTAMEYIENYIEYVPCEEIDFNLFCFHTFEEAFKYCIDLKEGL